MKYYTYILRSEKDGRFYFGQTQNLEKRLEVHNAGKSAYTSKYLPWNLNAYKVSFSRKEAVKYESMLKKLHGQQRVEDFILKHDFIIL